MTILLWIIAIGLVVVGIMVKREAPIWALSRSSSGCSSALAA